MAQTLAAEAAPGTGKHTILEQLEISDDEDDEFRYEAIPEDQDDQEEEEEETLDDINKLLAETKAPRLDGVEDAREGAAVSMTSTKQRPAVVDDFIRNFLIKHGMKRSLDSFQTEWYELQASGKLMGQEVSVVPDLAMENRLLEEENAHVKADFNRVRNVAEKAKASWDKFRKERDFHRMHHRRVVQEKNKLLVDLKRLKRHYEQYEPTLTELRHKYEVAMKEKMLMRLERDRFMARAESLQKQVQQAQVDSKEGQEEDFQAEKEEAETRRKPKDTPWPSEERTNPYLNTAFEQTKVSDWKLARTFKGHNAAISRVAFHPKIPVVATASDDHTWKMWSLPNGELVMSGEGHKDWVSGICFHPRGSLVATTSGDSTVKIWDMLKERCRDTITDHTAPVWQCAFHDLGDFLISCSMDQTCRAFDIATSKCRQTFRGHVDSVNHVAFQPFSSNLLTASGDKTVSLWDLRSGLCVQTFYGHQNACNSAIFNTKGDSIVSCDADGIVKLWDVRVVSEYLQIDTGQHPANAASLDRSGKVLAVASGDASVKLFDTEQKVFIMNMESHEDSVQDVAFEPSGSKYLVSCSSDCTFRLWQ